ncbi:MAG: hemolysin family protein [Alphaproteobacteria bacterium]|uniref:Hemolysin family protein n=1 Tax=Candidatus Nitrobium versatile TaxID=2884831 RepID=A0A953SG65_9BACT|nr:hemolysin family protein [Candidatus Nitrobium versatile]
MWLEIFLIAIFIFINGFFAASEIAVVTIRRTRIKQLVEEGNSNAKTLSKLREEPDRFLATIQFGVTLAGALASAIGGAAAVEVIKPILNTVPLPFIAHSSEAIAIGAVVLVITYFSLVFGELIPKSLALSNPEGIGLLTAPLIDKIAKLGIFFIRILTVSTNIMLRPFGKKAFTERAYISEEEVKLLIEEGGEQGVFEPEEKELIHSVFEFTDTSVKEVMIPAPQMVILSIGMSVDEAKTLISEEKFSRYPVIGRDINDIRGILYAKDFYNILSRTEKLDIHRIIKPPFFVPETMKISILLREMQKRRVHMAIVIDEYGAVSGLVTLEDLLEEIVGEIRDEYDTESPVITLNDGSMIIDASISVRDLNEDYHVEIPESNDYETLGGFIVTHLQRIPRTGDTVNIDSKTLKVVEMVAQRIAKVKLERIDTH